MARPVNNASASFLVGLAEVFGLDLSEPLSDQQFQAVHNALMDNLVLFFRDQKLTVEQHKALGSRFGKLLTTEDPLCRH